MVRTATGAAAACVARAFPFVDHTTHVAIRVRVRAYGYSVGVRCECEVGRARDRWEGVSVRLVLGFGRRSAPYTPAKHVLP